MPNSEYALRGTGGGRVLMCIDNDGTWRDVSTFNNYIEAERVLTMLQWAERESANPSTLENLNEFNGE